MKSTVRKIALLFLCLALSITPLLGCANQMERPVAKAAGYEVLFEELRFVVMTKKAEFQGLYGKDVFDTPEGIEAHRAEFEAAVIETLKENYVVLAACNHYLPDLKITDDDITDAVDVMMEETIDEMGGEESFDAYAEAHFMTENLMRFTLAVYAMETRLLEELASRGEFFTDEQEDEFFDWIRQGNGVYVQHVLIRNDAGDNKEANRALAESTREALQNGTLTIEAAIGGDTANNIPPVNEDTANAAPYYLVKGVYDTELENAALPLKKDGDVSEVTETDEGFYIFVRIEDTDDLFLNLSLASLLSSYQWAYVESLVEPFRKSVSFEWTEFGKELDWLTIQ